MEHNPTDSITAAEYEAWLLPAERPATGERLTRGLSQVAGWSAFIGALLALYLFLG